jgi:malate dehydrogenase (oxaloacetate-decarboxylating)(NADP+)
LDEDEYRDHLEGLLGQSTAVIRKFVNQAATDPRRIVFPEATDPRILQAVAKLVDQDICLPVLLGSAKEIQTVIDTHGIELDLADTDIADLRLDVDREQYRQAFYDRRHRKGIDQKEADLLMSDPNHFGMMMVAQGRAEGLVAGINAHYRDVIRPALQILGLAPGVRRTAGMYLVLHHQRGILFFADATVNIEPDAETLADVAEMVADAAARFDETPRVAMLSMSNFGSVPHPEAAKMAAAARLLAARRPDLEVEGEMQANVAVNYAIQSTTFPFTRLTGPANVLIFPNLDAGNAAYKLMRALGGLDVVGPVLLGMKHPVTVLERDCDVDSVVLMTALTVVQAQERHMQPVAAQ